MLCLGLSRGDTRAWAKGAPELKRNADLRSPKLGPELLLHLLARPAGFLLQDERINLDIVNANCLALHTQLLVRDIVNANCLALFLVGSLLLLHLLL